MVLSRHWVYLSSIVRKGGTKERKEKMEGWEGDVSLERSRTWIPRMQTHRVHPDLLVDHAIETRISLTLRRLGRGGLAAFHPRAFSSRVNIAIFFSFFLLSRVFSIRREDSRIRLGGEEKKKERFDRNLIGIVGTRL